MHINVGKIKEIDVLDQVIEKILKIHKNLIVCMDANSRNPIWDPSSLKLKPSSTVRKMGNRMSQLVLGNSMEILNNCEITYESGEHATAVDITITRGINAYGEVKWKTIPDELQTPHKGIIIDVGSSKKDEKRKVIDWKKFEWDKYSKNSKDLLKNLAERWRSENLSVPTMSSELRQCLEGEVEGIAKKKMVSNHSKPWIDPKVSSLLKDLHEARRHSQRHRSQRNIDRYKDLLDKV